MSEGRFTLIRRWYENERTIGELFDPSGEHICFTLEPGTKDPYRLAVGFYHLAPYSSPKYPNTYALVGLDVSAVEELGVKHNRVLLHSGNRDDDTEGCIIPGRKIERFRGETAVMSSAPALTELLVRISGYRFAYMRIKGGT